MSPIALETAPATNGHAVNGKPTKSKLLREPLKYSGSLDQFKSFEVTPIVGREYPDVQLMDLIKAPNAEQLIRDLAITISERGVVFFRNQEIDVESQKKFTDDLGRLSGRPEGHGLHPHPLFNSPDNTPFNDAGDTDINIYVISSKSQAKLYKHMQHRNLDVKDASASWHSDGTFENCPNDYSCLKLHETPTTGGDTMFASQFEVYERMSPSFRSYLETLTAECHQPVFKTTADLGGYKVVEPRGSPLNVGDDFAPHHPMVRTNPVTGWKGVFPFGLHMTRVDNVTSVENDLIKEYIMRIVTRNHDLQCRMKWGNNDVAIWDNRSVFHSATPDLTIKGGVRTGNRASSVGERPYLDPASKSRTESLAALEETSA